MEKKEEVKLIDELKKMQHEPWLPVESKLTWGSIGLGIALLIIFILINKLFFISR